MANRIQWWRIPPRINVVVVSFPKRWRLMLLWCQGARALRNRFPISSSSPPPPSPGWCFLACRECKSYGPRSVRKKRNALTTRKEVSGGEWPTGTDTFFSYYLVKTFPVESVQKYLFEHWCHFNSPQFQVSKKSVECRRHSNNRRLERFL